MATKDTIISKDYHNNTRLPALYAMLLFVYFDNHAAECKTISARYNRKKRCFEFFYIGYFFGGKSPPAKMSLIRAKNQSFFERNFKETASTVNSCKAQVLTDAKQPRAH